MGVGTGLLASALMGGVLAYALLIQAFLGSEFYYLSLQEDEALEWATFWAFLLAAGVFGVAGWRQWRAARVLPWFAAGVASFCARGGDGGDLLGPARPGLPATRLLPRAATTSRSSTSTTCSTWTRAMLGLRAVIAGYGIALPLLALVPPARRLALRIAILPPPVPGRTGSRLRRGALGLPRLPVEVHR